MKHFLKRCRSIWHTDLETRLDESNYLAHNLYAMNINSMLIRQGIDWNSIEEYQFYKKIHDILVVYNLDDDGYIRIGRDNDGGYVMRNPISENKIAYSIGISNDVSWDSDMVDNGYRVYMYDHTIDHLPYEKIGFNWKKIGISGESKGMLLTLDDMLMQNGHSAENGMALKMDVEGAEWEVLNSITGDVLNKFDQIVMEIHNLCNISNEKMIIDCLSKICSTHNCIHVHGNNSGMVSYCNNFITPDTLEVTFIKKSLGGIKTETGFFPKQIDQPCVPWRPDIKLGKWNN